MVNDAFHSEALVIVSGGATCVVSGDQVTLKLACLRTNQLDNALRKPVALGYCHYVLQGSYVLVSNCVVADFVYVHT